MFLSSTGLGRHCCYSRRHLWLPLVSGHHRSLSTQTRTLTTLHHHHPDKQPAPLLILSSSSTPDLRYIYELSSQNQIKRKTVMELPEIAGRFCIGSSQGYLFTIPPAPRCNFFHKYVDQILAINPMSGRCLPLPTANLLPDCSSHWNRNNPLYLTLFHGRAVSSPSLDTLFLLRQSALSIARVGSARWSQHDILTEQYEELTDCVFYNESLYAVNKRGELFVFHPTDPAAVPIYLYNDPPPCYVPKYINNYLVVSPDGEDLFLVYRDIHEILHSPEYPHPRRTNRIEVFKLHKDDNGPIEWKQVESLGDLALFIGANHSIACHTQDFPHLLKPNCIYFTDDDKRSYKFHDLRIANKDTGVFFLDDGRMEFYELRDGDLIFDWPPPVWLLPSTG